jgi:hypothetical protein
MLALPVYIVCMHVRVYVCPHFLPLMDRMHVCLHRSVYIVCMHVCVCFCVCVCVCVCVGGCVCVSSLPNTHSQDARALALPVYIVYTIYSTYVSVYVCVSSLSTTH